MMKNKKHKKTRKYQPYSSFLLILLRFSNQDISTTRPTHDRRLPPFERESSCGSFLVRKISGAAPPPPKTSSQSSSIFTKFRRFSKIFRRRKIQKSDMAPGGTRACRGLVVALSPPWLLSAPLALLFSFCHNSPSAPLAFSDWSRIPIGPRWVAESRQFWVAATSPWKCRI